MEIALIVTSAVLLVLLLLSEYLGLSQTQANSILQLLLNLNAAAREPTIVVVDKE